MDAFEIEYKENKILKWHNKYINYSDAITMITNIANSFNQPNTNQTRISNQIVDIDIDIEDHMHNNDRDKNQFNNDDNDSLFEIKPPSSSSSPSSLNHSNNMTSFTELNKHYISSPYGIHLQDLALFLDQEIKTVYLLHLSHEKELFTMLNNHLHKAKSYPSYNALQLASEIKKLHMMLKSTKQLCDYIHWNMLCLAKIAEVSDALLVNDTIKTSFMLLYLRTKIEFQSSDINYIFQCKLIDEISVIAEYLCDKAVNCFKNIKTIAGSVNISPNSRIIDNNNDSIGNGNSQSNNNNASSDNDMSNSSLTHSDQRLLDKFQESIESVDDVKNQFDNIKTMVDNYQKSIREYIDCINDSNYYRIKYKNYQISIRYGFKAEHLNSFFSGITLNDSKDIVHINCLMDEELIIKKFLTPKQLKMYYTYNEGKLTKMNKRNFIILYAYVFIYYISHSLIFTHIALDHNTTDTTIKYKVLTLHLGSFLSYLFYGAILKQCKRTKIALMFSFCSILFGLILYILPQYPILKEDSNKDIVIIVSTLLIGFGLPNTIVSKYFITYSYPSLLRKVIRNHHLTKYFGVLFGFLLGTIWHVTYCEQFLSITTIALSSIIGLLLLLSLKLFIDPKDSVFHPTKSCTQSVSSEISINHRKRITIAEQQLVSNANQVLYEENKNAMFNEFNQIPNTIKSIIKKGDIQRSYTKAFFAISIILVFIQFYPDYYFYHQNYNLKKDTDKNYIIGLSYVISYLAYILIRIPMKRITKNSRVVILLLLLIQVSCGIGFTFVHQDANLYIKYCVITSMLIINLLIEMQCNRLLVHCISQDYNIGAISGSMFLSLFSVLARIVVYGVFILIHLITNKYAMEYILKYVPSISYGIPLIGVMLLFGSLKMKAIHKVNKKHFYM